MMILPDVTNPYNDDTLEFISILFGVCNYKSLQRRYPDSNWGIKDLQSSALPLGYTARNLRLVLVAYFFTQPRDPTIKSSGFAFFTCVQVSSLFLYYHTRFILVNKK